MTKQDWTALSGDPMCDETMDEWASDMVVQLVKMAYQARLQTIQEMTDDERETVTSLAWSKYGLTLTAERWWA